MTYRFLPPSLGEIEGAREYYDSQSAGLGSEFLDELEGSIDRILKFPKAWFQLTDQFRACSLQRFPYSIIYTIEPNNMVLIVSVFHHRRKPFAWRENL